MGITTNLFPAMTLGCGAVSGNATGDNVGPRHLFHIKRVARWVRSVEEAFPDAGAPKVLSSSPKMSALDKNAVLQAVERYLAQRGVKTVGVEPSTVEQVVDRFLASKGGAPAASCGCDVRAPAPAPVAAPAPPPSPAPVPFVCEDDVRQAMRHDRKIFIGPKTILTPSARDLGEQYGVLVQTGKSS